MVDPRLIGRGECVRRGAGQMSLLKQVLTNVTDLQVASLAPGTVALVLGSDFTGLAPAAQASPVNSVSSPAGTS